ncbi:MAG: bifunctional nuclease family protein [Planctomycetota bacterium]
MDIPSELNRIVISETSDQQMVLIKEIDGTRKVPIIISIFEAIAIDRAINNRPVVRPMTHDLLAEIITALGATVERVTITKIADNTFYAELRLETNGVTRVIDARPSDSIAIAVRLNAPIFVNESVYKQAGIS